MTLATPRLSTAQILLCGALIVSLTIGVRHGFGLWLQPITQAQGWTRDTFSLAMAVQNLSWGFFGIFAGMLADRFGSFRVIVGCVAAYAAGLAGMALSASTTAFVLVTGVVLGMAHAGATYAVIYGVIGRQIDPSRRSWAMGVVAAAGSFGQFLMVPVEGFLIASLGWQQALLVLAAAVLVAAPLALGLREPGFRRGEAPRRDQSIAQAVREAFRDPSFRWLTAGYFVCGFQVMFIGVHMPSYLKDHGLSPQVASYSLALIGLFNVVGTYVAGALGQKLAKGRILAFIYLARAAAIAAFLGAPLSPLSVYLFSAVLGLLWLSTVPPVNAAIAQIFGIAHLSMLSGFVFFGHQVGAFAGVWMGGLLYDRTGSYDLVWFIAIALGVVAALASLPVRESPIVRRSAGQPA